MHNHALLITDDAINNALNERQTHLMGRLAQPVTQTVGTAIEEIFGVILDSGDTITGQRVIMSCFRERQLVHMESRLVEVVRRLDGTSLDGVRLVDLGCALDREIMGVLSLKFDSLRGVTGAGMTTNNLGIE